MLSAGGPDGEHIGGGGGATLPEPEQPQKPGPAAIVPGEPVPGHRAARELGETLEALEAVADAGGQGPLRLIGLGITLLILGLVLRWGQDITAPYVNLGEADMAGTVVFDSDGGIYRVVTSGPSRPELRFTVCEATGSDGSTQRELGRDGVKGGHSRFGVTRVTRFDLPAGRTEIRCGNREVARGAGLGRFQVVDADGPVTVAITGLLGAGAASLLGGIAWFIIRFRRHDR